MVEEMRELMEKNHEENGRNQGYKFALERLYKFFEREGYYPHSHEKLDALYCLTGSLGSITTNYHMINNKRWDDFKLCYQKSNVINVESLNDMKRLAEDAYQIEKKSSEEQDQVAKKYDFGTYRFTEQFNSMVQKVSEIELHIKLSNLVHDILLQCVNQSVEYIHGMDKAVEEVVELMNKEREKRAKKKETNSMN